MVPNGLDSDSVLYVDQDFTFSKITPSVQKQTYIKTAWSDRKTTSNSHLSFQVNQDANVYVAHEDGLKKPDWLGAFQDSGEDLIAGPVTFSLFRKAFKAGTVTLGGNIPSGTDFVQSMYVVIVLPMGQLHEMRLESINSESVTWELMGSKGDVISIEVSNDLKTWHTVGSKVLQSRSDTFTVDLEPGIHHRFYRLRVENK